MAPSALMRMMIYKKLSDYKSEAYAQAADADDKLRQQSVRNRADGRSRAAAARKASKPVPAPAPVHKPILDLDELIGKIFS